MSLTFQDLLAIDVAGTFLNLNEHGEYLILRLPCGRKRRLKGIANLQTRKSEFESDRYSVQILTVQVDVTDLATEPEEGTAIRRLTDPADRWFSYSGPGEGEATGMLILEFIREVPLIFGGNRSQ